MVGGGSWEPGAFTDDTQMAVLVAESLLDCGGVDQVELGARFKAWLASHPKDVGITTRSVLASNDDPVAAAARYFERWTASEQVGPMLISNIWPRRSSTMRPLLIIVVWTFLRSTANGP